MADLKNNLFYYATKELSQDAFICWLCSYALEDVVNPDMSLRECAIDFIEAFLKEDSGELNIIDRSKIILKFVEKQKDHIDVLLTVEYKCKSYKIIIEDKIHTSEHGDQLTKYRNTISSKGDNSVVIGIYFKTGFQSDYSYVEKTGYKIFDRIKMLEILNKYVNKTSNAIFRDYHEYWYDFECATRSYKTNPCINWDWRAIYGFYEDIVNPLHDEGCWTGYEYVANQSGGFDGFWYGISNNYIVRGDFKAELYLQIEPQWNESKNAYDFQICLKLKIVSAPEKDNIVRLESIILSKQRIYGFCKPKRLGHGKHITTGLYCEPISTYDDFKIAVLTAMEEYQRLIKIVDLEMP